MEEQHREEDDVEHELSGKERQRRQARQGDQPADSGAAPKPH